jgi:putative ABC transport system permease protein
VPIADAAVGVNQRDGMVRAGTVLMSVVGLVLLIACVNLANLMLARGATRTKEISLRAALGAARSRIISQLMTESVVLSLLGGGVGLLVAFWGRSLMWSFRPGFLNQNAVELTLDSKVLGFTLGISLITGVLFGLLTRH